MKNRDLDKILTQLGNYDPQAKPNWDAFLADNESRINANGKTPGNVPGKGILSNKTVRYAGAFMVAAAGLVIAWYFAGSPQDSSQPEEGGQPQKTEIITDQPEQAEVPEMKPTEVEPVSTTVTEDEQSPDTEELKVDSQPEQTKPEATKPEPSVQDQDKSDIKQVEKVTVTDTVFLKKTIYITDTVKRK